MPSPKLPPIDGNKNSDQYKNQNFSPSQTIRKNDDFQVKLSKVNSISNKKQTIFGYAKDSYLQTYRQRKKIQSKIIPVFDREWSFRHYNVIRIYYQMIITDLYSDPNNGFKGSIWVSYRVKLINALRKIGLCECDFIGLESLILTRLDEYINNYKETLVFDGNYFEAEGLYNTIYDIINT